MLQYVEDYSVYLNYGFISLSGSERPLIAFWMLCNLLSNFNSLTGGTCRSICCMPLFLLFLTLYYPEGVAPV